MSARYAVYYAPGPGEPLARFGAATLGYDAETGADVSRMSLPGVEAADLRTATSEPRFYGFHATLKAPFHLAAGCDENELREAFASFVTRCPPPFDLELRLGAIAGFLALTPVETPAALHALESAVVDRFEPFRAPLTTEDLARRLKAPLTERQKAHLARYGYPYVKDEFRFHMTLSGPLGAEDRARLLPPLRDALAGYLDPPTVRVASLALFRQDTRREPFRIVDRAFFPKAAKV